MARAHPVELRVAGLGASVAPRVSAAAELGRRVARELPLDPWLIRTPTDVAEPLVDAMGSLEREELRVLLLDTKNVVIAERTVYRGNLAGSSVRIGEVYRDAVRACAAAIIVAHNHPSGDTSPSGEDLRITAELADAGRLLDIELLDHLVIGRGRWTSLRALGRARSVRGVDPVDPAGSDVGEVQLAVGSLAEGADAHAGLEQELPAMFTPLASERRPKRSPEQ